MPPLGRPCRRRQERRGAGLADGNIAVAYERFGIGDLDHAARERAVGHLED